MKLVCAVLLLGCASALPFEPIDGLLPVVAQLKGILSTDYGFKQLKSYLLSLDASDPIVQEVHGFIHDNSDEELKKTVNAFFANIPILAIEPGFDYPTMSTLFGEVKAIILTEDGIKVLRSYLEHLHSNEPLLKTILSEVKDLDDEGLTYVASVLLGGVKAVPFMMYSNYDTKSELQTLVGQIRNILTTTEGLMLVRKHVNNLQTTNPKLILAKTVLSAMSDRALIDLVTEACKDIPAVPKTNENLLDLIKRAKALLITEDGIAFLRDYFNNLKTANFLIGRIPELLKGTSDAELIKTIDEGFTEIFGYSLAVMYMSANYDTKSDLQLIVGQIKKIVSTSQGLKIVRDHLNNLQTTNPNLILAKTILSAMSDSALFDLVNEAGKNIPDAPETSEGLLDLIRKGKDLLIIPEGIQFLRDYFENLQTGNFLIVRVKSLLKSTTNEKLRETVINGFAEIFGYSLGANYAMYTGATLQGLFAQIKHTLKSKKGFQDLRNYIKNLQPKNAFVAIGRQHFITFSDARVHIILDEFLGKIPDIEIEEGFNYPGLAQLFKEVKELIVTPEGLQTLRDYGSRLMVSDPAVEKLQLALETVDDDTLIDIFNDLFSGL